MIQKISQQKTRKHANTMFGFDFYRKYKIHCLVSFLSLSLRKARVLRIVLIRLNNYKTPLHCTVKQKILHWIFRKILLYQKCRHAICCLHPLKCNSIR